MHYVYVLYSKKQDKFYIGITKDLKRRILEHKRNKTSTTLRMDNPKLIYYEAGISEKDTQKRERQLKTGFGRGYLRKRLKNYIEGT